MSVPSTATAGISPGITTCGIGSGHDSMTCCWRVPQSSSSKTVIGSPGILLAGSPSTTRGQDWMLGVASVGRAAGAPSAEVPGLYVRVVIGTSTLSAQVFGDAVARYAVDPPS